MAECTGSRFSDFIFIGDLDLLVFGNGDGGVHGNVCAFHAANGFAVYSDHSTDDFAIRRGNASGKYAGVCANVDAICTVYALCGFCTGNLVPGRGSGYRMAEFCQHSRDWGGVFCGGFTLFPPDGYEDRAFVNNNNVN